MHYGVARYDDREVRAALKTVVARYPSLAACARAHAVASCNLREAIVGTIPVSNRLARVAGYTKVVRYVKLACLLVFCVSTTLAAQTPVVNPCCIHFQPSPDHFTQVYDQGGNLVDVVTRYDFTGTAMNPIGAIALTKDLGKPAPGSAGTIDVNLSAVLATMTIGAVYTATVTAVGPGGSGVSTPSNPFAAGGTVPAPRAATSLVVNKTP